MCINTTDRKQEAAVQHRELCSGLCDDGEGWGGEGGREVLEGGDICKHLAVTPYSGK